MRREQFWEKTAFFFLFLCVHGKVRGVQQKKKRKWAKKKHEEYFSNCGRPQAAIDIILSIYAQIQKGKTRKKLKIKQARKTLCYDKITAK